MDPLPQDQAPLPGSLCLLPPGITLIKRPWLSLLLIKHYVQYTDHAVLASESLLKIKVTVSNWKKI